ncbi:hypothetical protein Q5P01_004499 [Channa striata]|uniref:Ig-like domain-containing protein n=1 Tax=Channa striata TaxID=64152 RepID=A0AA88NHT6_CHASR|nr:hypothetical protein Q5P01_004499 [Channa striata]
MQSCVLPCSFQSDTDVIIHWIQTPGDLHVHSYYQNQDQLGNQDQNFRGRTSLFKEQISGGNASLQLTGVRVQDQGGYKCHTSTITGNKDGVIQLKVDAPVRKIHIEQVGNRITCSSQGIYPKPELTWSTDPPSSSKSTITVHPTEQQLYNISSSLILSDPVPDVIYSCRISTCTNTRRTTLRNTASINSSSSDTTLSCATSNSPPLSLIWRFNHSQIILSQSSDGHAVSKEWRQQVKSVSETGGLTLHQLSAEHQGTYTCEFTNKEETHISNTVLRTERGGERSSSSAAVTGLVFAAILVLAAGVTGLVIYCKKR